MIDLRLMELNMNVLFSLSSLPLYIHLDWQRTNKIVSFIEIAAAVNSSSSNSNSPISLSKISTSTSGSGSGSSKRNRKVLPVKDREYDPEKHCGVRIGNVKPCTRSLTCKTHQISLRRNVEGRSKPFDQLLADHRNNAKDTHKHSSSKQVWKQTVCFIVTAWINVSIQLQFVFSSFFSADKLHNGRQWQSITGIDWWQQFIVQLWYGTT